MFRDQVGVLAGWFKGWNECEQTVALLSLLKRVSRTQARFLQLCLEHSLADCTELHILEGEANNPGECWRAFSGGALMPSKLKKKNTPKKRVRFGSQWAPLTRFSARVLFSKRGLAYFSLVFRSKLLRSMAWCNYGSMNDWWGFFFPFPPVPPLPPSMQFPVK